MPSTSCKDHAAEGAKDAESSQPHSLTAFEMTTDDTAFVRSDVFGVGGCLSELLDASVSLTAVIADSHRVSFRLLSLDVAGMI